MAYRRVDPAALFDVQIKRIHEYKRQLLNVLEADRPIQRHPRPSRCAIGCRCVKIFAGKAAAGLSPQAKLDHQADQAMWRAIINRDPAVRGLLKVIFIPNYNVSAWRK